MSSSVLTKFFEEPPICEKEILRYAGCRSADEEVLLLLKECLNEARDKLAYKVCYRELPVRTEGNVCDFEALRVRSEKLALCLKGCGKTVLFAATLGVGLDRLIAKYSRISPSKALMFQAIGAERIEALCDAFCSELEKEYNVGSKPRFSPGYADLSLECQKEIFRVLDCERRIGLTLNSSLIMSPSKSVTAFVGLGKDAKTEKNKCSMCSKTDCAFRGV